MFIDHGRTPHTTSPALAATRGSHFDALLAHVLEEQVNRANGDSQEEDGDKNCKHVVTWNVANDGDMLPPFNNLAQRLLGFGFTFRISAMTISISLSAGLQGIQAGMQRVNIAGSRIATSAADPEILATNAVDQMSGRHQVGLSAQVVRTADQMLGTLIDLKA